MGKIEIFGKSLDEPKGLSGSDLPIPEPFGGIPSGIFAIFAVVILTASIASYIPNAVSYTHLTLPTIYSV